MRIMMATGVLNERQPGALEHQGGGARAGATEENTQNYVFLSSAAKCFATVCPREHDPGLYEQEAYSHQTSFRFQTSKYI